MTARLSLLRFAAKNPLSALALAVATPIAVIALASGAAHRSDTKPLDAGNPRAILGRAWFDAYPEKAGTEVGLFVWLAGGIGIYEKGSAYRASFELFDFERQGDRVDMTFLEDKKRASTRFSVHACDERPPFDLCLDLVDSPRGPKRYYGFGDLDDMERAIPWSKGALEAARARATAR